MDTNFIHVGSGNYIAANRVITVLNPASAPIQRLVRQAKKTGTVRDVTHGRRTKAVVFMDDGSIILAATKAETIVDRVAAARGVSAGGRVAQASSD